MTRKLLVIGLDGASFNVLDPLIEDGQLPNIANLISSGVRSNLETTFPPITAVAWSSFMTGVNPGKHGIFEFIQRNNRRELAVNASFRSGKAIWDIIGDAGLEVIVHGFPCTYPPRPLNGLMVTDFMTPRGRRDFTFPGSLLEELESRFGPYRLHLSGTYAGAGAEGVLEELFDELEYKARVCEYLMLEKPWDAFFQYFWGTDRIQHELWHVIDESHPRFDASEAARYSDRVHGYFRRVDQIIGRLMELAGKDALICIASDHGFGPAHKYCSFNVWLLQEGFLKLKTDAVTRFKKLMFSAGLTPEAAYRVVKRLPLKAFRPSRGMSSRRKVSGLLGKLFLSFNDVDWERTLAFSRGNYGQIYVNLKGREPDGAVAPENYEKTCSAIVEKLKEIEDPVNGGQWVGDVFRREQIYKGPRVTDAPDIAFLPRDMRYLPLGNADFTSNRFVTDAFGISGCHRMNGVLILTGEPIKKAVDIGQSRIYDVAPTLLYLLDQPVPQSMDGRVLTQAVAASHVEFRPPRFAAPDEMSDAGHDEFTREENEEVIERLKGLGYLG